VSSEDSDGIPGWATALTGASAGGVTILSDPKEWLFNVLLTRVVSWVLDGLQYVVGWGIYAYERTASILLTAAGPLTTPAQIGQDFATSVFSLVFGGLRSLASSMGLAAPIATAFAVLVLVAVVVAIAYASLSIIPGSDAVPAITGRFKR
jgi:hypothetical protein